MPLPSYGLLTGTLVGHGPQDGGNPHYLLQVRAGSNIYRVAVNLKSSLSDTEVPPELQYQIIDDLRAANAQAQSFVAQMQNSNAFSLANPDPTLRASNSSPQTLDFVHDSILNMADFQNLAHGTDPENNPYYQALVNAANEVSNDAGAFVAVFGTGYGVPGHHGSRHPSDPRRSPFGFMGVDNVHMNQGNFHQIGSLSNSHYFENGRHQDGAVICFYSDGRAQGFFSKFQSQDNATDDNGNPVHTGISELDNISEAVRLRVAPTRSLLALPATRAAAILSTSNFSSIETPMNATSSLSVPLTGGFVFADPAFQDSNNDFKTDDDSEFLDSPFVAQFAKYDVPEPVPGPRGGVYPVLSLVNVLGEAAVKAIKDSNQIVFHAAGDTGAPVAEKLPAEVSVADLMVRDFDAANADRPSFYFHLGDVVYYYGEQEYYYDQFYKPYQLYPAPIFAIPGNHDGITYSSDMISLQAFKAAFCDSEPHHWQGAAGISRTTMIQPGVFFTLDAPFVSIIGLYSNCSEHYGYLDQQQKLFFYNELMRLKALRESGEIAAVLLAVHHPPLSYAPHKPSSGRMRDDLDAACAEADFWPDAVLSGHAHVFQRMTRTVGAAPTQRQIPYVVAGSGGYAVSPKQEINKQDFILQDVSDPQFRLHRFLANFGYLRLTVRPKLDNNPPTLRIEFLSPDINAGQAADACVLDLDQHRLL